MQMSPRRETVLPDVGVVAGVTFFTLLSFLDRGSIGMYLLGVWWAFLLLGPIVALVFSFELPTPATTSIATLTLGFGVLERWSDLPWWVCFAAVSLVILVAAFVLRRKRGARSRSGWLAGLVLVTAFAVAADSQRGGGFWRKAWMLRRGMTREEVFAVMKGARTTDEAAARELTLDGLPQTGEVTLVGNDSSADSADLDFRDGRLVWFEVSRD
ncbi:MAG TPA: hypothetical protein ENJ09_02590 [Planctomycetes bacterium]|nr:hypothetical protein [Planctomycetota bacterium]